jgi:IS30 family transposase
MDNQYTRLGLSDRETISRETRAQTSFTDIARMLGRSTSTVSREVWVNTKYSSCYGAVRAEERSAEQKQRHRPRKMDTNPALRDYVFMKLRKKWSPEEIAQRLAIEYSHDKTMRISHESIYQYLYCLPRGELKRGLMKELRQERKHRLSRAARHYRRQRIQDIVSISERPKEVEDRVVPGHREGDLIVGKNHESATGTLVERTTRLTLIVPLKKKDAFTVRKEFAKAFLRIPVKFRKSLTYDRGTEMSEHRLFTEETKIQIYFADPLSPWQRGTNSCSFSPIFIAIWFKTHDRAASKGR